MTFKSFHVAEGIEAHINKFMSSCSTAVRTVTRCNQPIQPMQSTDVFNRCTQPVIIHEYGHAALYRMAGKCVLYGMQICPVCLACRFLPYSLHADVYRMACKFVPYAMQRSILLAFTP